MEIILFKNNKAAIRTGEPETLSCSRTGILKIGDTDISVKVGEHTDIPKLPDMEACDAIFITPNQRFWNLKISVREGVIVPENILLEDMMYLEENIDSVPEKITSLKYKLASNGRGVLLERRTVMVEDALAIEFDCISDGYTAVIQSNSNAYSLYRQINNGVALLEREKIAPGVMKISVIKDDAVNPIWVLDELYAVCGGEAVAVGGNTLECDKLLAEQRAEMDELRLKMSEFQEELLALRNDFDENYKGRQII
jgi:hypothetical protein